MDPSSATSSTIPSALSIPSPSQQHGASQRIYAAQTITITPAIVTGDVPLALPFQGLFDRPPMGTERDILLDFSSFIDIARFLV